MLDLIYTAFLVPILVGFEISDVDFGWGCLVNLIAGMHSSTVHTQHSHDMQAFLLLCVGCCTVYDQVSLLPGLAGGLDACKPLQRSEILGYGTTFIRK